MPSVAFLFQAKCTLVRNSPFDSRPMKSSPWGRLMSSCLHVYTCRSLGRGGSSKRPPRQNEHLPSFYPESAPNDTSFKMSFFSSTTFCRAAKASRLPSLRPLVHRPESSARWQLSRTFASTPARGIAVADMTERDFASLKVNQERLMNDIHSTSEWGKGERWGE